MTKPQAKQGEKGEARGNIGGRPTKYEGEKTDKVAQSMAMLGATEREIAQALGICTGTLWIWKREHKGFLDALTVDKAIYDKRVEDSLAQRALGYTVNEEKVYFPSGSKEPVKVTVKKHVPASDTAAIFWLKNRQPHKWRDRQDLVIDDKTKAQQISTDELEAMLLERIEKTRDITPVHEDSTEPERQVIEGKAQSPDD